MFNYEINCNTVALVPINDNRTRVIEVDNEYIIEMSTLKIIERSCEFFGSSYIGRQQGTKKITGISTKPPIIIEESREIIYFPTMSPRLHNCTWFALKYINNYKNNNGKSLIYLDNGKKIELDISYESFDNQFLRATKLESMLRKRKLSIE
jgi:competence protein ComK